MDPVSATAVAGGLASATMLRAAGCTEYALTASVRRGDLRRVRRGWYTTLDSSDVRVLAVRCGGRLTGLSALHWMNAWVLDQPQRVHVAVGSHSSGHPADPRVLLHWEDPTARPAAPGVAALSDALVRVALDEPPDVSVPCFDWALATNSLDRIALERALLRLPSRVRGIRRLVDPRSQSVLESVARVRLRLRGWSVRSQVKVADISAIDLVVEDHIALELDGRTFHESTFERDRRKDLAIAIEGRHSLRISKPILREAWAEVELAIAVALAARRHGDVGISGELVTMPRAKLRARGMDREVSLVTAVARGNSAPPRRLHQR